MERRRAWTDTSTVQIRTSETVTSAVTRSTVRDAIGRVISETNPEHATTHVYDPYDQRVGSTRTGPGLAPTGQTRAYGLDARGYLLSEDLPEVDGIVTYKPDALGLPRRTFDGLNTLDHVFDGAGRLTEVKDLSGKRWKQLIYASSNDGTNRRKGKLEHVLRNNAGNGEDLGIVETYEYRAALGKASRLTTKIYYPDRPRGSQFGASFQQDFAYDRFGNVRTYSYPKCVTNGDGETPCNDGNDRLAPSHTVTTTFNQGIPRTVTSSLGPITTSSYHFNFQPSEMVYGNGVTGTFAEGPAHLPRPKRIEYSTSAGTLWDSGDFTFDGVGNIATIGDEDFIYARASRLLSGTVRSAGTNRREDLTYDAADNVTSFARDGGASVAHNVDATTNRLLGRRGDASILWDAAGSVTSIGRQADNRPVFVMTNGPFRRQTSFEITDPDPKMPSRKWSYLYGPGDVRLMVEDHNGERRWTFRDLSDRIVREYLEVGDSWKHERDFVHGPSGLMATRRHNGMVRYFHADHLGTPRLYTAVDGKVFSRKNYYPFGAEIEDASTVLLDGFEDGDTRFWLESKDERRVEWTGHERDPHGLTDYMLARTCLYPFYRFGSVDPGRDGWNLFAYARNNPVAYVDPDGEESAQIWLDRDVEDLREGTISREQYFGRIEARGKGALLAVTLVLPGEEILVGAVLKRGVGSIGKLGRWLRPTKSTNASKISALPGKGVNPKPGTRKRPEGVPEHWRIRPTKSKGGTEYYNPKNPNESVRVMQGNPKSPYPNSQSPYVRRRNNAGSYLDADGIPGGSKSPETHIPLDQFKFFENR